MSRPYRWAAGVPMVVALLAACSDDPAAPDPPGPDEVPAAVEPAQQWSGGEVTLTWPWLVGQEALPEFRIGDSVLAAVRSDDSTVTLTLPQLSTGTHAIAADVEGAAIELTQVAVFGYTSSAPAPWLYAQRPWPSSVGTEVVGVYADAGEAPGKVQILDLASGAVRDEGFPRSSFRPTELGLSYRPGAVVLFNHDHGAGADNSIQVWQLDPGPVRLDSAGGNNWDQFNQIHEFGPGRRLMHHEGDYWTEGWPVGWFHVTGSGRIVPSPDWTRAIPYNTVPTGAPSQVYLFNAETGQPLYLQLALRGLVHGAFTQDGSESFLVAYGEDQPADQPMIVRADAASGEVLATTSLPATDRTSSTTIAVAGERVLVAFLRPGRIGLTLLVLRAADLSPMVELPLPEITSSTLRWPTVLPAPDGTAAHLLTYHPDGAYRHRVDLLPE